MFNEVAVLDGEPNPVMALAVTDCLTWVISCQSFHALLAAFPRWDSACCPCWQLASAC